MKSLQLLSLLSALLCTHFTKAEDTSSIESEIAPSPLRTRLEKTLRQSLDPAEVRRLIKDLGHTDFSTRAKATQRLLRASRVPAVFLESATNHDDPEIQSRARRIMTLGPTLAEAELNAVLIQAATQHPSDIADLLLEIIVKHPDPSIAHLALAVADACPCNASGAQAARSQIGSPDTHLQLAAISLLVRAGHAKLVLDRLTDFHPPILAEVGRALWNHGHPGAIDIWVGLLEADDVLARVAAAQYLREATSQRFGFSAHAEQEHRQAASKKWKTWQADHPLGSPRQSRHPVASLTDPFCPANYRLAAAGKSVFFIGTDGSLIATLTAPKMVDAVKMTSSRTLILFSRLAGSGVLETTLAGFPFRRTKASSIVDVTPTGDGGIIVFPFDEGGEDQNTPLWIARDGSSQKIGNGNKWLVSGVRLPGGNFVVATEGMPLRRITGEKKGNVWKLEELDDVGLLCPLPNGNILVSSIGSSKLAEVSPGGTILWKRKSRGEAVPQPLRNGNILIQREKKLSEETPDGTVIWKRQIRELKGKRPPGKKEPKP